MLSEINPIKKTFSALQRIGLCCFALWCGLVYSGSVFGQSARYHYGMGLRPLVIETESAGGKERAEPGCAAELVVPLPGGVQVRDCIAEGGATAYQLQDHLGSPRVLVASSGALSGHCAYDAYGVLTAGGALCAYTGHKLDSETGLYRTPTRFYGAEAGRFASVDPVPENWTPYSYAGNQPTGSIDPSGSVVLNITENARGELLPNPEGIVIYAESRVLIQIDGIDRTDFIARNEAKALDNFLAIRSEDFFYPHGTNGGEDISIVFPDVDVSGIRYVSINMHGTKNGAIAPFVDNKTLTGLQATSQLFQRLHSQDPRYGTSERTIMEQLQHISCQTCYGARVAEPMALILSMNSSDRNTNFVPDSELSIVGSPYSLVSIRASEIIVATSIMRTLFDVVIGIPLLRWNYNRTEIARGNISRRALGRGDFKRYAVKRSTRPEERYHINIEPPQPRDPASPDVGGPPDL